MPGSAGVIASAAAGRALIPETQRVSLGDGWHALIVRDWDATHSIAAPWNALARSYGDAGIFLEHGWFEQWWRAFGTAEGPFVLALCRGEELAAIVPCRAATGPSGSLFLTSMTSEAPYDVLVAAGAADEALRKFIAVLPRLGRVVRVRLEDFSSSSQNRATLEQLLVRQRIPFDCYREPHSPYVDVKRATWDEYTDGLHSKLKNNLRKGRRRAEKDGTLSFRVIERTEALDALMTEMFDVEERSWKGTTGTAIKADPRKESFYRRVARWAMDQGRLSICALRLGDRLIAFDLSVIGGRTMFALKTGYDATVAGAYSPGNIMRFEAIKHVFMDARLDRYDFLGRCYPWKLEWTSAFDERTSFELFEPNLRGRLAYFGRHGWKRPFKASPMITAMRQRIARLRSR